jgi:hypothetical protein
MKKGEGTPGSVYIAILLTFIVVTGVLMYLKEKERVKNTDYSYLCPNMSPGTEWYTKTCGDPFENLSFPDLPNTTINWTVVNQSD